ncbi:MAG: Gfo/Idh/MocA family oxidoreductase [Planctomycetes bacterium]|nr:Gfo/Idh/MocA family oxidoreductase [Planctomycetota bacterium]
MDQPRRTSNFGLVGAAGFVAPRHLKAIRDTGNRLIAAADPHDSVGVLDGYFPEARFFTEIERFDRHLEKLRRRSDDERMHYLSVCSPNYLHDAHVRLALRLGADAICEKPLVINPWNLDELAELEAETGRRIHAVMQLRYHPALLALRERLRAEPARAPRDVVLTYVSRRGAWYHVSWKGSEEKSGGLAMNLGVHFFDLLVWLFGPVEASALHLRSPGRMSGAVTLERARVRWLLSVDLRDVPAAAREAGKTAWRSLTIDGEEVEFSDGFGDLHTRVYEDVLAGGGLSIEDARPGIDLVHAIRTADPAAPPRGEGHPLLEA